MLDPNGASSTLPRIDSQRAISSFRDPDHVDNYSEQVESFELDLAAIQSLSSLVDVLFKASSESGTETSNNQQQFIIDYVAPLLGAKAKSPDPTESAASILLLAHLIKNDSRTKLDGSRKYSFNDCRFNELQFIDPFSTEKISTNFSQFSFLRGRFSATTFNNPVNFADSDLTEAKFDRVSFQDGTNFAGAFSNFTGQQKYSVTFAGATFKQCDFFLEGPEKQIKKASFPYGNFQEAHFFGKTVKSLDAPNSNFDAITNIRSVPARTKDTPPTITNIPVIFDSCNFTESTFNDAPLAGATFKDCTLTKGNFSTARLTDVAFINGDASSATFGNNDKTSATSFSGTNLKRAYFQEGFTLRNSTFQSCPADWAIVYGKTPSKDKEGNDIEANLFEGSGGKTYERMFSISNDAAIIVFERITADLVVTPKTTIKAGGRKCCGALTIVNKLPAFSDSPNVLFYQLQNVKNFDTIGLPGMRPFDHANDRAPERLKAWKDELADAIAEHWQLGVIFP